METPDPRSLVVLAFDSALKAEEAYLAVTRLQTEARITLHDAVFIGKDIDGSVHVRETVDVSPGDAALRSGVWGALIGTLFGGPVGTLFGGAVSAGVGALAASFDDYGIQNATLDELREAVQPGSTALALLISHVEDDAFLKEMHRFEGAKLLQANLPPAAVMAIRQALAPRLPGSAVL